MYANQFGGLGLTGFEDFAPFCLLSKTAKNFLQTMGVKNGIG